MNRGSCIVFVASRLAGSLFALIVPLETWTEKKQGDFGIIDMRTFPNSEALLNPRSSSLPGCFLDQRFYPPKAYAINSACHKSLPVCSKRHSLDFSLAGFQAIELWQESLFNQA
jgi:hypothetical protein